MQLNEIHNPSEHASTSLKVILLVFALVLVGTLGYLVWDANNSTPAVAPEPAQVAKKKALEEAAKTPLACGDTTKYGFTMSFSDKWDGYKIKQVLQKDMEPQPGYALVTCYFQMPTTSTDEAWTKAGTDHDPNYASLFAVSVYTPEQWQAAQEEPNRPTKLGETSDYIWGLSQAQSIPDDLAELYKDVKNVASTFSIVSK
jgi:hypothetical protein